MIWCILRDLLCDVVWCVFDFLCDVVWCSCVVVVCLCVRAVLNVFVRVVICCVVLHVMFLFCGQVPDVV